MLEESRGYLSSFMIGCVYEGGGLLRPSIRYFFADVIESINGRRDPLPVVGVKQHICMYDGDMVTVPQQHERNVQRT